jgi:hypothetical protein
MVVTLDAKRRLTVRAALAPAEPGAYFDAHFDAEEDAIVFRRLGGRELAAGVEEASYDEAFLRDECIRHRHADFKRRTSVWKCSIGPTGVCIRSIFDAVERHPWLQSSARISRTRVIRRYSSSQVYASILIDES